MLRGTCSPRDAHATARPVQQPNARVRLLRVAVSCKRLSLRFARERMDQLSANNMVGVPHAAGSATDSRASGHTNRR